MDSFVMFMHLFNCLPNLHLASKPYMPMTQLVFPLEVQYKSGKLKTSALDTDFSISTVTTGIILICPGESTKLITVQKPIHVLWLPPACSATSPHFHLPPWYAPAALTVNISLDMANLKMVNMSSLDFHIWQHLKDHRNETQLHQLSHIPSVPIAQL